MEGRPGSARVPSEWAVARHYADDRCSQCAALSPPSPQASAAVAHPSTRHERPAVASAPRRQPCGAAPWHESRTAQPARAAFASQGNVSPVVQLLRARNRASGRAAAALPARTPPAARARQQPRARALLRGSPRSPSCAPRGRGGGFAENGYRSALRGACAPHEAGDDRYELRGLDGLGDVDLKPGP